MTYVNGVLRDPVSLTQLCLHFTYGMSNKTRHDYKAEAFESKRKADATNYQFIREKILEDRNPTKVYKVVSLPGPYPTWEENLEKAIPKAKFEFHGVESDTNTWVAMVGSFAAKPDNYIACEYNERSLEDFIRAHRDFQADIVYGDFTNGSSDKEWELYRLMKDYNFLAEDAIIMHTIHLRRDSSKNLTLDVEKFRNVRFDKSVMDKLCDVIFAEGEHNGSLMDMGKPYTAIPKVTYKRLKKAGIIVEIKSAIIYRTRKNPASPSPMIQILCQREKDS